MDQSEIPFFVQKQKQSTLFESFRKNFGFKMSKLCLLKYFLFSVWRLSGRNKRGPINFPAICSKFLWPCFIEMVQFSHVTLHSGCSYEPLEKILHLCKISTLMDGLNTFFHIISRVTRDNDMGVFRNIWAMDFLHDKKWCSTVTTGSCFPFKIGTLPIQ